FQAEDGIRDRNVTGVQTCALPIFSWVIGPPGQTPALLTSCLTGPCASSSFLRSPGSCSVAAKSQVTAINRSPVHDSRKRASPSRSEERRVGKEGGSEGSGDS